MPDIFEEAEETALAEQQAQAVVLPGTMGEMQQAAEFLSRSTIIPAAYQSKPANCFVALEFAQRTGWTAMEVMQGLYIIQGKPSWSSQSLITFANSSGKYTPIRYKFTGTKGKDDWGCIAYMTEIATGELLEGPEVTIQTAKDEGWYNKSGSKWKTLPQLMLQYRSAAFLIRTYAPELTMGLKTYEEIEDMKNITPGGPIRAHKSEAEAAWENSQKEGD